MKTFWMYKKRDVFAFLACLLVALPSWAQIGREQQAALPVIVAPVVLQSDFADRIEALGTLRADESVIITADIVEIVDQIYFKDGQQVQKGDILVTLVKNEEEATLKSEQALLDERMASYRRAQELVEKKALSTATLEGREALLRQTEGDVEAIKSRIADRVIRAPFAGVLGLREISPGALVRPGDLITTLDALQNMKVDFEVPSVFLQGLHPGLPIEGRVEAFAGDAFKGVVSMVGTRVDPATRTMTVRAALPNPDLRLKPGLLMSIELLKSQRAALLVPEEAILQKEKQFFVFKIIERDGKSVAVQTEVTAGSRIPGKIEILEGLERGDQVIVHGLMQVRSGQEISIRAVEDGHRTLDRLLEE